MGWRIELRRRHSEPGCHYFHGQEAESQARRDFDALVIPGDATAVVLIRREADGTETVVAERRRR